MKKNIILILSIIIFLNTIPIRTFAWMYDSPPPKVETGGTGKGGKVKKGDDGYVGELWGEEVKNKSDTGKKQSGKSSGGNKPKPRTPEPVKNINTSELREILAGNKNMKVYFDQDGTMLFVGTGAPKGMQYTYVAENRISQTKETTRKAATLHWDWTLKNVTDSSIPSWTRRTEKHYLRERFPASGKWRVETIPYCSFERGYTINDRIIIKNFLGDIVRSTNKPKQVTTKKWNDYDSNWKAVYEFYIHLEDIDKEIVIPLKNEWKRIPLSEIIDELVE